MSVQLGQNMNSKIEKDRNTTRFRVLDWESHGQRSLAGYHAWGC